MVNFDRSTQLFGNEIVVDVADTVIFAIVIVLALFVLLLLYLYHSRCLVKREKEELGACSAHPCS